MSRTYASEDDFKAYLAPDPVPEGAARLLRDASLEVDDMLLTAIYHVDHDDMPTDPKVRAALRDATCAQAEFRAEYGDELEAISDGEAISLGPIRFGGKSSSGVSVESMPKHAPKALRHLRLAGLTPGRITDG